MRASVEAVPREEFDAWLEREADAQAAGTSNLGKETFTGACAKCHGLAGEGLVGPRLQGNSLLDDDAAVEQVIREGRGLDAAGGPGLGTAPDGRADRLLRRRCSVPLTPRRPPPPGSAGRLASWLVTTDHKRIGILYLATSGSSSSPAASWPC
jgi:hypothetical protein